MMKRTNLFLLSGLTIACLGALTFGQNKATVLTTKAYPNHDASTYYSDILDTDTGSTLTNKLNTLNNSKRRNLIDYYSLTNYFPQTDPGVSNYTVTSFYSGEIASKNGVNREHVWPFSKLYESAQRGDTDIEKDLQMVRPILQDINEARGNSFFVEGMTSSTSGWDPGAYYGAQESYRGDIARIIFYSAIADLHLTLVDKDYDANANHTMGKLSTLLDWNLRYPILERENVRNEATESIQGHRNPFIDHPEYACRIWGNYNSNTKNVCASYGNNGHLDIRHNGSMVKKIETELQDELSFAAYYQNANNPTFTWAVTNQFGTETTPDVIEITSSSAENVTVRAIATGTGYIKVTMNSGSETLWSILEIKVNPICNVTGIEITSFPHKITYKIGETFSPSGITVIATFDDRRTEDVTNVVEYGNTNFDTVGKRFISVSYTYKDVTVSASFPVFVEKPTPPQPAKSGCGGNIVTTSVLLSSLSLISAFLITITVRKRKRK